MLYDLLLACGGVALGRKGPRRDSILSLTIHASRDVSIREMVIHFVVLKCRGFAAEKLSTLPCKGTRP